MIEVPDFAAGSKLLADAYRFALDAHSGDGATEIEHPTAVARLLAGADLGKDVVAAALLHDVVEDTPHELDEIEDRFGARVRGLVEVMTEDASISSYEERKAEHRGRVLAAGEIPATIYAADKLARVRRYARSREPVAPRRLAHYRRTLEEFSASNPDLPFLEELGAELPELEAASS